MEKSPTHLNRIQYGMPSILNKDAYMKKWLLQTSLLLVCVTVTMQAQAETKVLAFAGSTRADSYNKKLVCEAAAMSKKLGAIVTVIDLKEFPIPLYDADSEAGEGMPSHAKCLRELMIESDAIIIASPEYNSSVSAVLKNALDWASRSEDENASRDAFKGKKFAIMSASPGKSGGARGLVHLRTIIEAVGGSVIQKQVSVPEAYNAFDEQGLLKNAELKQELELEVQQLLQ